MSDEFYMNYLKIGDWGNVTPDNINARCSDFFDRMRVRANAFEFSSQELDCNVTNYFTNELAWDEDDMTLENIRQEALDAIALVEEKYKHDEVGIVQLGNYMAIVQGAFYDVPELDTAMTLLSIMKIEDQI